MNEQELKDLIDSLPEIDLYKGLGGECYAISGGGSSNKYEILLDTGEVVRTQVFVRYSSVEGFKEYLTETFRSYGCTFIGKGVMHK